MKYENILIVRTDRIGDVVLTLPLIEVLRKNFPSARITFLARSYTKDIVEGQPGLNEVALYDKAGRQKSFLAMLSELRRAQYDLAVVAFPRFRIALLLWLARVGVRVGSGYRWYSVLFNRRVYEHRKKAAKHEFEFNLSLVKTLGCTVDKQIAPHLTIDAGALRIAADERKKLCVSGGDVVVILHPGSGGSARDWKLANFRSLAIRLRDLGWKVVVTGARGEESIVQEVARTSDSGICPTVGRLSLKELAAFIQSADLFVSNSTGPLHVAAAVGTPVIGLYPPIVACSPQRWGPIIEKKVVFVPNKNQCELCKGGSCRSDVCMDQITVEHVVGAARQLVKRKVRAKSKKIAVYS